MTCQLQIQPLTALVPVPRFQIGERVTTDYTHEQGHGLFTGVIIEQVFRIKHDRMNWQYTIAITEALKNGVKWSGSIGEYGFDLDENTLTPVVGQY
ncbi:MAG: hypothetical protein V7L26_00795 [Nostoc sp.]|uniref:hypothetical protein n=1 Tax=Nostoc sp. TaxID=1180 RepID=UPI002FF220F2